MSYVKSAQVDEYSSYDLRQSEGDIVTGKYRYYTALFHSDPTTNIMREKNNISFCCFYPFLKQVDDYTTN